MRVAILGLTHDHIWGNLAELVKSPLGKPIAGYDPHPGLREKLESEFQLPTYTDPQQLLDNEQPEAVWVFADNRSSVDLAELALERGLPVMMEKPMAADRMGADRVIMAARRHHARLMINWPFCWWPELTRARQLVHEGAIGRLWEVKYRAAHAGPRAVGCSDYFCDWLFDAHQNGSGALHDYAGYGAALARLMMGPPSRVTAIAQRVEKSDIVLDDNAVVLLSYPQGLSVLEASWSEIGDLTNYTASFYGTKGTLHLQHHHGGKLRLATPETPDGQQLDVPALPNPHHTAADHFLHCVQNNEPFEPICQDIIGRDAAEIVDAALESAQTNQSVSLPLPISY